MVPGALAVGTTGTQRETLSVVALSGLSRIEAAEKQEQQLLSSRTKWHRKFPETCSC